MNTSTNSLTVTLFTLGYWYGPPNKLAGGDFVKCDSITALSDQCQWDQQTHWADRCWCDNVAQSAGCNFLDTSAASGDVHNMQ